MEKQFQSQDFYLSALLICEGHSLKGHFREKGFTTFIFSKNESLMELVNKFYSKELLIEPLSYGSSIRNLKGILHSSVSTSNQLNSHVQQQKGSK